MHLLQHRKKIEYFYKSQNGRYRTDCKVCVSNKKKEKWNNRTEEKKTKDKLRQDEWVKNNKDKVIASAKKSREKQKTKDRLKKYYENNKDKLKDYKSKHYLLNIENYKNMFKEYRKTKEYKIIQRVAQHNNRKKNSGKITSIQLKDKLIEQENKCYYCDIELNLYIPRFTHIDHKIPLCKGGSNTIDNIVWCCSNCNLKKGIKLAT